MVRASRRTLLALAGFALVGCLSPTLPLPPPSRPVVEGPDEQGMVTLDGTVPPNAAVYAANLRTSDIRGQFTAGDGHYRFAIGAQEGDELELWYSVGTDQSPSIVIQIHGQ